MTDAPKCPHCDGWGHEPDVFPLAKCTVCAGAGRPPAKQPEQNREKELLDG